LAAIKHLKTNALFKDPLRTAQ